MPSDLIGVIAQLSLARDLDGIVQVLREGARSLTGADGVTVVLRDGDMCHYADESAITPLWKGKRFPMSACISGWCMLNRRQVAIADIYADPRIPHDAYRPTFVRSLAMTPIRAEDPIGAIGAYWARHHEATAAELETLQSLGTIAAVAISNVELIARLEGANRRKDEFLAMLAHELRNPLAPIRNAIHLLESPAGDAAIHAQARELMKRQVTHLSRIVDDLLDVARATRGTVTLRRERVDLARLVGDVAGDRAEECRQARLELRVETPDAPVPIEGDPTRLTQILGNLLHNACKFTPAGGTVVISLRNDARERCAVLTVRDTGIGIAPEILPRVFEVFAQGDRSLDRPGGGLGLGLAMARSLIELHGGRIEAASEGSGRGATFTIRLPTVADPPALAPGPPPAPGTRDRLRVLIIEDNRDSAESLRMLLEASGHEAVVAHDGAEGVERANETLPDVVLCDIGLPVMDGFAVAAALRSRGARRSRLIAVTGYGGDEDRRRSSLAGFDAHLVKPVDPGRLLQLLQPA